MYIYIDIISNKTDFIYIHQLFLHKKVDTIARKREIYMNRFPNGAKKIGIISIILVVIISYGLFFYLQYMTENNIRNSLFEQQKQRQIESTKALSQHVSADLDSIMARLQDLANSAILQQGDLSNNKTKKIAEERYFQINSLCR